MEWVCSVILNVVLLGFFGGYSSCYPIHHFHTAGLVIGGVKATCRASSPVTDVGTLQRAKELLATFGEPGHYATSRPVPSKITHIMTVMRVILIG